MLRHDPLREETYRLLMRLHALNGDRPAALRAYHVCVTVLRQELGVEPDGATRRAYQRLLKVEGQPEASAQIVSGQLPGAALVWWTHKEGYIIALEVCHGRRAPSIITGIQTRSGPAECRE